MILLNYIHYKQTLKGRYATEVFWLIVGVTMSEVAKTAKPTDMRH